MDASISNIGEGEIKAAGGFFAGILSALAMFWAKARGKTKPAEPKDTMQAMRLMVDLIREDRESQREEREAQREERKAMRESLAVMSASIAQMAANIASREQKTEILHREHAAELAEQKRHLTAIEGNQIAHLNSLQILTGIARDIGNGFAEMGKRQNQQPQAATA